MFLTEEDWSAAFDSAEAVLRMAVARGDITVHSVQNRTIRRVAEDVATAVIRAPVGDLSELAGSEVPD